MCFVLLANTNLAALGTLLQQLLAYLNFTLESEDLFCDFYELWQQQEQLKSMEMIKFDLIFFMRDLYINSNLNPLTKLTSSSRSTELKDIFPWNIFQMITKTIPISTGIAISCAMKRASCYEFDQKSMETETWSEFPSGGNATVEQKLALEEKNKCKRAALLESQSGIRVGKLTVWVRSVEIEKL